MCFGIAVKSLNRKEREEGAKAAKKLPLPGSCVPGVFLAPDEGRDCGSKRFKCKELIRREVAR